MQQLTQKLKTGSIRITEVPFPLPQKGCLLVQNHYSLISAGTEGGTVKTARKGYIGKAKERPEQVKQVVRTFKTQGPVQTYRAVMKKLDSYSPLGYSCVGKVIGIGQKVQGFKIGDFVACGGLTASHAEIVSAPVSLCVKLDKDADLKQAAYNTLGAIAIQGVRQAGVHLGETCGVIGLGLIGQLTALLLKASGVRVIGIDVNPAMVETAQAHCTDLALVRTENGAEENIRSFTNGLGCDAVIITAASSSLDPINFAGAICRKRGTVVVVGNIPTGFDREPHFYKKELQVKMSCSYGPGRYDPVYEEKGLDYPAAYVRWTENRNMQAFQSLIQTKNIDVAFLTTHTFKLEDAPEAYDMMMAKSEPFIGILIEYDITKKIDNKPIFSSKLKAQSSKPSAVNIGFIGAGSYAQSHLLPNVPKNKDVSLEGVMTTTGTSSTSVAERFKFEFCTTDGTDIIENDSINTVFIATRHDSHAHYVMQALKAGKHVFTEKPLCLTIQQLDEIAELLAQSSKLKAQNLKESSTDNPNQPINQSTNQPILMVGYNRRFSPFAKIIKEKFGDGPMAITYRVNAGAVAPDSWIQDADFGGGRIIGEVCHFVDLLTYVNGSLPDSVHANVLNEPNALNDTLTVSLKYENGSIGTICYFANGDTSLPKERVEVYAQGCTAVIEDFQTLSIHAGGKKKVKKLLSQDKGQKNEVKAFIEAIIRGSGEMIPLNEIFSTSLVTFKIIESIQTGTCIKI